MTSVTYNTPQEEPPKVAWKIYAWTMLALVVITFVGRIWIRFKHPSAVTTWDLFEPAFSLVLMLSLFGYVYQRPYLAQVFWEITVPLAWSAAIYSLFSPKKPETGTKEDSPSRDICGLSVVRIESPWYAGSDTLRVFETRDLE